MTFKTIESWSIFFLPNHRRLLCMSLDLGYILLSSFMLGGKGCTFFSVLLASSQDVDSY